MLKTTSGSVLPEEDWAPGVALDRQGDESEGDCQEDHPDHCSPKNQSVALETVASPTISCRIAPY